MPKTCSWVNTWLIPSAPKDTNNIPEAGQPVIWTVLSPLSNLDISGPSFKRNCADGFLRQWYPMWAAWVREYPEQVIVALVSYGSCPMCEIPNGASMGLWIFWPPDNSGDHHDYLELLANTIIDALHSLGFHPIYTQFWQYPLCNVFWLCQTDLLHHLLLGFVKVLLNRVFDYLKVRNLNNQFDNRLISVPQYLDLLHISKQLNATETGSWINHADQWHDQNTCRDLCRNSCTVEG